VSVIATRHRFMTMNLVERVLAIVIKAYEVQIDKASRPYILHLLRVMSKIESVEARCLPRRWQGLSSL
jgi:hypothetical protein